MRRSVGRFERSEALLGREAMARLAAARVLVVGVGGVGSWCAEALVRTGVGHVTLVDDDVVAESNVNRQCPATSKTIGRPKVEVMAERLLEINPSCEIEALPVRYPSVPSSLFSIEAIAKPLHCPVGALADGRLIGNSRTFASARAPTRRGFAIASIVIDAIDSVDCKAQLILDAFAAGVPVVSSMGAALRTDPTKVKVVRFDKVEGDGLAKALRNRFRKLGQFPGKFPCVCSTESPRTAQSLPRGSLMPVTATFGMCLAAEAMRILIES